MYNDIPNHPQAILQVHGGSTIQPRPSIGSWVSYGLGTMSQDLPSYLVLAPEIPYAGSAAWDSSFLPAFHQGVRVIPGKEAIPNMTRQGYADIQEMDLGMIDFLNQRHLEQQQDKHGDVTNRHTALQCCQAWNAATGASMLSR